VGLQFSRKIKEEEEYREAMDRYLRDNTNMSLSSSLTMSFLAILFLK
jgi:hypothetical protein